MLWRQILNKKEWIANKEKEYNEALWINTHPYAYWLGQQEVEHKNSIEYGQAMQKDNMVSGADGSGSKMEENPCTDFFVLCHKEGKLRANALDMIAKYFSQNPEAVLLYGDEDGVCSEAMDTEISSDGTASIDELEVCNPWLKPDWSPDTFQSFFYFGNVLAIRKCDATEKLCVEINQVLQENINAEDKEKLCAEICNQVLSFDESNRNAIWNVLKEYTKHLKDSQILHLKKILFHFSGSANWEENICFPRYAVPEDTLTSIIIPSKDHPELVKQCMESIRSYEESKKQGLKENEDYAGSKIEEENKDYIGSKNKEENKAYVGSENKEENANCRKTYKKQSYEIIVVDNGSNDANKIHMEELSEEYGFHYHYETMDFNFSKMCNIGASLAKGEVLLFLNDDITVQGKEWLEILTEQALQPGTGAVGAKLYYPDSTRIQHAGITNMGVGPAHKLGGMVETGNLYHMRSRAVHNVIAVTAAALAIERRKFDEVGGFDEELAVAYNDVDLGFRLYEKGYYNVQRNDVILFHHESISRGADTSPEKEARLLRERKRLYEKHPNLNGVDPFYHPQLVQMRLDAAYHVNVLMDYEKADTMSFVQKLEGRGGINATSNSLIRKVMRKGPEMMMSVDAVTRKDGMLLIEGWASMTDASNLLYERELLLVGENCYKVTIYPKYRPDTKAVLVQQSYAELSGFVAKLGKQDIAKINAGKYQLGMLFTDYNKKTKVIMLETEVVIGESCERQEH